MKLRNRSISAKTILLISAISICGLMAHSQNIVVNPSFSAFDSCLDNTGQINRCTNWHNLTSATPDYYNACDNSTATHYLGVPENAMGYQTSPSNSYAGVLTADIGYREYFGAGIPALETGKQYRVTMLVSLANGCSMASDGLGVYFYRNAKPDTNTYSCLTNTPQVDYSSLGIITDTTAWVTLTKIFVADSAYTHFAIGSFKNDTEILADTVPNDASFWFNRAYYYIDSVSIEKIESTNASWTTSDIQASIYPNPVSDFVKIEASGKNPIDQVELYNGYGALVKRCSLSNTNRAIDCRDLPNGVYYCRYTYGAGDVVFGKVLVQH